MKFIHISFLFVLLLSSAAVLNGQSEATDRNGRAMSAKATATEAVEKAPTSVDREVAFEGDDQDIPGRFEGRVSNDIVLPDDLLSLEDELLTSETMSKLVDRMEQIEAQMIILADDNEELRAENRMLRSSLQGCCSAEQLAGKPQDAYLVQNSPNPATVTTRVEYFLPSGMDDAIIQVYDMNGVAVKSFPLQGDGHSMIDIESTGLASGTYLYYLSVGGEVVDSKVMVIK